MKTFSATPRDIEQRWFIVDADGMVLGRLTVDRPSLEDIYLRLTGDDTRIEGSIR